MSNRTAWTGGNLFTGTGWNAAFNGSDLNSIINLDSVLSSITPFGNNTSLDQFMDISVKCTIASSAVAAGATVAIWLAMLQLDGTTIGDGLLTAGTASTVVPAWAPLAVIPLFVSTRTTIIGGQTGIMIPPGQFALIFQNNVGFTLASSGNSCSIRTYNQNLNN